MKQEELNEVLRLHELWVNGDKEGVRADLTGAFLSGSNLSGSNLSGADLTGSFLDGADLKDSNLFKANLSGSDLFGADLTGSDLTGSDLSRANLAICIGNGVEIKNIETTVYDIAYTSEVIHIGCKNHTIDEWRNFSDEEISVMDKGSLRWWKKNKQKIFNTIEENPATPTQGRKK